LSNLVNTSLSTHTHTHTHTHSHALTHANIYSCTYTCKKLYTHKHTITTTLTHCCFPPLLLSFSSPLLQAGCADLNRQLDSSTLRVLQLEQLVRTACLYLRYLSHLSLLSPFLSSSTSSFLSFSLYPYFCASLSPFFVRKPSMLFPVPCACL
jgi:hypothetical protein